MRLRIQDLSTHLQRGLAPLYFVVGEEPQQQIEALNKIRTEAYSRGYIERERYDISPQFDWENFKTKLGELNLFSEKRFIEGRLTGNISKLASKVLVEIASNPPPETLLLFSSDKLESAVAKSVWFTTIERLGVTLWPRPLSKQELEFWINNRVKTSGLNLNQEAIHTLMERTEGNLLATHQALEKLLLYSESKDLNSNLVSQNSKLVLTAEQVIEITSVDTQFSLFDLVDSAILGNISRTKQIFTRLKSEGIEPILILWAMTREVRAIIPLAQAVNRGSSLSQVIREHNLWKHKISIYTSFLNRSSFNDSSPLNLLHQFIIQAKDLDSIIKGRKTGDTWSALFLLCLNLAGASYDCSV